MKSGVILISMLGMLIYLLWIPAFAGGVSEKQTVKWLNRKADRTVFVSGTKGAWGNPDVCDNDNLIVLSVNSSNSDWYKETYAMLLGAHLTKRNITARLSGCKLIGTTTYPIIKDLKVF
jgi:hypothetical protein